MREHNFLFEEIFLVQKQDYWWVLEPWVCDNRPKQCFRFFHTILKSEIKTMINTMYMYMNLKTSNCTYFLRCVLVMIIWKLDLQLPMQSLPITTKVVNSNPVHGEITTICDKACQWLVTGQWFSPVSSTNKTDCHDIIEILLNVALNIITLTPNSYSVQSM